MPASVAEIETVRADLAQRAKAWRADTSGGAALSPVAVVTLAGRALADARLAIDFVAGSFIGTVPPPPWPAGPEFIAARARVAAHRDAAEVIVRRTPAASFKAPEKVRAALLRDGGALYDQAADLLRRYAIAPRMPDVLSLLPDPRQLIIGLPVYLVALAVLWWAMNDGGA